MSSWFREQTEEENVQLIGVTRTDDGDRSSDEQEEVSETDDSRHGREDNFMSSQYDQADGEHSTSNSDPADGTNTEPTSPVEFMPDQVDGQNYSLYPDLAEGVERTIEPALHEASHNPAVADETSIYEGSDVSKSHLLSLTLAYVIRHQISGVGLRDLLDLLNVMIPGCVPKSKYYFDKYFNANEGKIDFHFYCPDCHSLLVADLEYKCIDCDLLFQKSVLLDQTNYFLTLPLSHQIQDLFENHDIGKYMNKASDSTVSDDMSDITDGKFYKKNPSLQRFLSEPDNISLSFSTDGVPVFKSSKYSIWPLFCTINELPYEKRSEFVVLHSLWFGQEKPRVDTYCKPFLTEMDALRSVGLNWHDREGTSHITKCTAILCVCDTVARPMLQNFKQFNGYYGCNCCLHPGEKLENKMVYPTTDEVIENRTHEQTVKYADEAVTKGEEQKGVKGPTPFMLLDDFDIITSFPPDYMHCVLLGVVRQVTDLMFNSSYHAESFYLGPKLQEIDQKLMAIRPPSEIKRSPRSLKVRKYWKASEWRTYLLYYSPIVLEGSAPRDIYKHWLLLVNAIHLLLGQHVSSDDVKKAKLCLMKFVVRVPILYGIEHNSFNIHLLTHLSTVAENWGPLWASSAFLYEGASGKLLNMFHGTQAVPLQIFKRFLAQRDLNQFAECHLQNATVQVSDLFGRLSSTTHVVKKATRAGQCTALGCGVTSTVSVMQLVELQRLLGRPVVNRKCVMFERFCINSKIFSTSTYSARFKRDNSIVQLKDGSFGIIKHCLLCKPFCMCEADCCCEDESFVILSEVRLGRQHRIYDDFAEMDLTEPLIPHIQGQNISVCRPSEIAFKCIAMHSGSQLYLIKLLKVDID